MARLDVELKARPNDEEYKPMILEILKSIGKPLRFIELWNALHDRGYCISDQKLKGVLRKLIGDGILMEFPDCRIGFPEWSKWYIPRDDIKRARPINRYVFFKLYGDRAPIIRRMGLPVAEALNIIRYGRIKLEKSLQT